MRQLILFALPLSIVADSFLRLCPQGVKQDPTVIPDCVVRLDRQEIRELTDEERTLVVDAFRKERAIAPRQQWQNILDPPGVYQLIQRLDDRLSSRHLSLPYWDTSLEMKLPNPGDSILFHPIFLQRSRRRRDRRLGPIVRPKTRFERRIRTQRDKTNRRQDAHRSRKLIKSIRRNKQSELLFLLHEMGDLFIPLSTSLKCPTLSPHLICSINSSIPIPKIAPASRCPSNLPTGICFKSQCIHEMCTIVIEATLTTSTTTTTTTTTTRETPTTTVSSVETTILSINETESIDNSTSSIDLSSMNGVTSLSDEVISLLSSKEIITPSPIARIVSKPSTIKQNGWYKYRPLKKNIDHGIATIPPKKKEKIARRAPDNSEEGGTPSLHFSPDGTLTVINQMPKERLPAGLDEMSPIRWQSPQNFPQVFFPITVIEGHWKGAARTKRADGATVSTKGLNIPIGFTTTTQALEVEGPSGLFIARVPDPEQSGSLVEFNITVHNIKGIECEQMCLNQRGNTYKPCLRPSIRISKYHDFSDPVQWSKSETAAIESEWIGAGYYRRRRLTHLLFTCPKTN